MLKQLHTNAVTVLQHTRTPPPGGTLSTFDSVLGLRRGRRAGRSVLVAAWAARARSGAAPAAATEAPFRDVPARTLIDGFPFDL